MTPIAHTALRPESTNLNLLTPVIITLVLLMASLSWNCTSGRYVDRGSSRTRSNSKKSDAMSVKKYFDNIGEASYYGNEFDGRTTSSGEEFSQDSLTAAHLTLPFNTRIKVTNLKNNKSVIVRINDRPPQDFKRVLDLSRRAAQELDMIRDGIAAVRFEVIK